MVAANPGAPGQTSFPRQVHSVRIMALGDGAQSSVSLESFAWGWFFALIFGPLYNFFVLRWP